MAASNSSDFFSRINYVGSWRGREIAQDIDWSMFPEHEINIAAQPQKLMYEDPDALEEYQRDVMRYTGPDTPTWEWEKPIKNKFSRDYLHLREGGARTLTDPYRDDEYDVQFHDHDPRGYLSEQPWPEYNRQLESRFRQIDFKDDSDNSIPSEGIHPNTMYNQIRQSQNWVKERWKIFENSMENFNNGGVGFYPDMSKTYKANVEDTTMRGAEEAWTGQVVNTPHALNISNYLHMGSKMWRVNSTPDQNVKTATYGKLYSRQGLIPHESALRILEDDTNFHVSKQTINKNLIKMLESSTSDNSSYEMGRVAEVLFGRDSFVGKEGKESKNKAHVDLTKDIMSLLGFTNVELKNIKQVEAKNPKMAERLVAELKELVDITHKLPLQEKITLKNQLLATPQNFIKTRHQTGVSGHIVRQLEQKTRTHEADKTNNKARRKTGSDNRLKRELESGKIYKSADHKNSSTFGKSSILTKDDTRRTVSYAGLTPKHLNPAVMSNTDVLWQNSAILRNMSGADHEDQTTYGKSGQNIEFLDSGTKDRHGGTLGTKYLTRDLETDTHRNDMDDLVNN